MRYVDPSFNIEEDTPVNLVAKAAHNCYQVEKNKDPEDFLLRLKGFHHYAVFEFGTFVVKGDEELFREIGDDDPFVVIFKPYVRFSFRPLLENPQKYGPLIDILGSAYAFLFKEHEYKKPLGKVLSEEETAALPLEVYKKMKFVVVSLITDRGVTHELVRHRLCSFAQESTRYCNYAKDKFGKEITVIRPLDYDLHQAIYDKAFKEAEDSYFALLKEGSTPEMARAVLPNKLKAKIFFGCDVEEMEHIMELRTAERAHPDIRTLFLSLEAELKKRGILR